MGRDKLGDWDRHAHTVYETELTRTSCLAQRMLLNTLQRPIRERTLRKNMCTCVTDSLWCSAETTQHCETSIAQ